MESNDFYFYNRNPLKAKEKDCVCRAISLVSNEDYYEIEHKLYLVSNLLECERLCVCCYVFLLEKVFDYKPILEFNGMKIKGFLKENSKGKFLIRCENHLTSIINGKIWDIWDCSNENILMIWKVE